MLCSTGTPTTLISCRTTVRRLSSITKRFSCVRYSGPTPVCAFIKLHKTAQSGPVIYSSYANSCDPREGFVNIFLVGNARASSHNSSPPYHDSRLEHHSLDINYNALSGETCGNENARNGGHACPPPTRACVCVCIYEIAHNRAIRPCHPSHSMPLALILPRGDQ